MERVRNPINTVYRILKREGITSQVANANTYNCGNDYGYKFRLKNGQEGKYSLKDHKLYI